MGADGTGRRSGCVPSPARPRAGPPCPRPHARRHLRGALLRRDHPPLRRGARRDGGRAPLPRQPGPRGPRARGAARPPRRLRAGTRRPRRGRAPPRSGGPPPSWPAGGAAPRHVRGAAGAPGDRTRRPRPPRDGRCCRRELPRQVAHEGRPARPRPPVRPPRAGPHRRGGRGVRTGRRLSADREAPGGIGLPGDVPHRGRRRSRLVPSPDASLRRAACAPGGVRRRGGALLRLHRPRRSRRLALHQPLLPLRPGGAARAVDPMVRAAAAGGGRLPATTGSAPWPARRSGCWACRPG